MIGIGRMTRTRSVKIETAIGLKFSDWSWNKKGA